MYLILTYQGAIVAMLRHLDFSTCIFWAWEQAMDLQMELA
jgi:hypothetical protein